MRDASPFIGIGATMAASLGLGVGVGYWLDGKFGTGPWCLLGGAGFGIVTAFYHLFKTVRAIKR
jgi:F0F1-type ATP synthase assembly protein I